VKLRLTSEYGTLRSVLMHRPGKEIDRLTPYNIRELLFEDVPYLEEMQAEHDNFTSVVREASGAKVYRLHELLMQVLRNKEIALKALKEELKDVNLTHLAEDIIPRYSTAETATILLGGIKVKELKKRFQHKDLDQHDNREFLINPNPNLYFMRDPAAIVQSGVISSQMKFPARQRESMITRLIFENHPDFRDHFRLIYPNAEMGESPPCIEGGDVIVLSKKALAIGQSERTDTEAIQYIARQVISNSDVERVYEIILPKLRNFMHLDTVFTIIDENLIVTYPDALSAVLQTRVYHKDSTDAEGNITLITEELGESILTLLKREIPHLHVIETGDGNTDYASREQWFDGANVFAIGPRRVISYNRNRHTNRALKEAGVDVIEIRGSELVRGLGGPRCMTMPLERDEL
jgi:arginine deiminase